MNFQKVTPTAYDTNSVTGTLPTGSTIVVSARQIQPFTINLTVVIDGSVVHDNAPTMEEKEAFYDLRHRAFNVVGDANDRKRADAVKAAQAAGIF